MKKSPNYIKKTLDEIKLELLKDKKLQLSRQIYIQKLKEIFTDQVIDLNDSLQTRMSSTGTDKTVAISNEEISSKPSPKKSINNKAQKVIFLNNEVLDQNINAIDEANNDLLNISENIIELKDEVSNNKNQKIIELIEEVENIINLTDEVAEKVTLAKKDENEIVLNEEYVQDKISQVPSFSNEQLELLNNKINDLDLNSSELTEKLDEILNQKNLFSEKFNDELDIKLTEALNRSEENLESKLNNINDTYHQEFSKYEDEANKNFANLEDQIGQLNNQFDNIQTNINSISSKIDENLTQFNSPQKLEENLNLEKQFEEKISDLKDYNLKIENSLNNLNNKIDETLDKITIYKNEASEKINDLNQKVQNLEPELINKIEERQKNKTESEKLQDKFDQMSKIMDMQNMRMLQMYHSSELQNSHSILQKNMETKAAQSNQNNMSPELISEELKKEVFPKIQKEMDKQFDLLKEQLSEYEIKSVLDKIGSTDLNREFKRPTKKFTNLFDAKKYVKNSISKKSRDWIKNNDLAIDEIAKKLLDK
ncbi:hypothetical protein [Candidatus Pelagibacter sp.]|uniref:hypothetical protein n=1 Tax=Candidatus Pelagibacter sp. TaxID=2024849 RepID=UPI003F864D5C